MEFGRVLRECSRQFPRAWQESLCVKINEEATARVFFYAHQHHFVALYPNGRVQCCFPRSRLHISCRAVPKQEFDGLRLLERDRPVKRSLALFVLAV